MGKLSYREKNRRFWRSVARMGWVFLGVGGLLVLAAAELYWHSEPTTGHIVGEYRDNRTASGRDGGSLLQIASSVVEYTVDGKNRSLGYRGGQIGDEVPLRYYRRWPRLAWIGWGFPHLLGWGLGTVIIGGVCLLGARRWG